MGAYITSIVMMPGEAEARAAHELKMAEVAKAIIGGENFPLWLPELLLELSFEVRASHGVEKMLPTKAALWGGLSKAEKMAGKLSDILRPPMMAGFLAGGDEDYVYEGVNFLERLQSDAYRAKNSPRLVTPGRVKPGSGRPRLPDNLPPKYICAAIIVEVWAFFHQAEYPKPSNRGAQRAAHLFYNAWFPDELGWGDDALKGWAYYFKLVGHEDLEATRKTVRRYLSVHRENNAA